MMVDLLPISISSPQAGSNVCFFKFPSFRKLAVSWMSKRMNVCLSWKRTRCKIKIAFDHALSLNQHLSMDLIHQKNLSLISGWKSNWKNLLINIHFLSSNSHRRLVKLAASFIDFGCDSFQRASSYSFLLSYESEHFYDFIM